MPFIYGFNFSEASLVKRSLQTIFGIGPKISQRIMAQHYIHPWATVGTVKGSTLMDITEQLSAMNLENDLRREIQGNIGRLRDMGTYRGRRHAMGLPVRGQNTRTQINTARKLNKSDRGGAGRVQM
ncbi:30S ribosomal protein S13 [Massarina eburnea CBS 473.64]|uniref:30S ribosomal protein S13 n=1 Tax=Massarina eburnea CBS 473.64 TaxID=1395130 RepID=A0A6A6SBP8_9PLEO|nr:30S ribosomal protein S13 [Massarina eburnea CBS 473.64]